MSGLEANDLGLSRAIQLTALRADVRRQLGLRHGEDLHHLVELGRPQGLVLSVLDGSSGLRDDLVALLRHSPSDAYADTLVTVADRMVAHDGISPPSETAN